jgi:HK97 family phage prohead protease
MSESGTISGYAMVFNSRSTLLFGKFYEKIAPEAAEGLIERSDVLALLDHQRSRGVLGRSTYGKGSLSLTVDNIGLRYEFAPPNTTLGDEVKEYLRRGDIRGSSFKFTAGVKDHLQRNKDGTYERTILKFNTIEDVSLVFTPAYPETTAVLRSIADLEVKQAIKKMDLDQLAAYYKQLQDQMNKFKT